MDGPGQSNLSSAQLIGPWVARIRMRLSYPLKPSEHQCSVEVGGRIIVIRSIDSEPLHSSHWICLTADGFVQEVEAREWVEVVRIAFLSANAKTGLGAEFDQDGIKIFTIANDPSFKITMRAYGRVNTPIPLLFDAVNDALKRAIPSPDVLAALELFSLSGVAQEPLSRAVLCLSAIELLAGSNRKLPVRKRFRLLFRKLGLAPSDELEFDAVYDLRSSVVHGEAPTNKQTFIDLADRSRAICQKVLKLAAGIP